ncbi:MAG: hypothetical protein ACREYE_20935 [Gammaproteobacteria bacterium]
MGQASGGSNQAYQETVQAANTEAKGAGLGGPAGNLASGGDQKNPFALSEGLSFNDADTRQRSTSDIDQNTGGGTVFGSDNDQNVAVK